MGNLDAFLFSLVFRLLFWAYVFGPVFSSSTQWVYHLVPTSSCKAALTASLGGRRFLHADPHDRKRNIACLSVRLPQPPGDQGTLSFCHSCDATRSILSLQHGQVGGLGDDHSTVRLHTLLAHLLLLQQLLLARDVPATAASTRVPQAAHSHQWRGPRQLLVGAPPTPPPPRLAYTPHTHVPRHEKRPPPVLAWRAHAQVRSCTVPPKTYPP